MNPPSLRFGAIKKHAFCVLLAVLLGSTANAASVNLSINISSPPATSLTFTPAAPFTGSGGTYTAPAPVAAGTKVGSFTVVPVGWSGALILSGTNAAAFSLSGMELILATPLAIGATDAITVTAAP